MIIERNIQKTIISQFDKDTILLLIGARQVGKTTLLRLCKKILEKRKNTVFYFTLEDPTLLEDLNNHPEQIFKYIKKDLSVKSFLLLDEIQYLKNPSNFLKYIYDQYSENIKIICTGSSAFYIDQKFNDSLAGRKRIITVHPFSFSEYLRVKTPELSKLITTDSFIKTGQKHNFLIQEKRSLILHWQDYAIYGGYPRIIIEEDPEEKQLLLQELHQSLLKKDIYEAGVKNQAQFYKLLKLLAAQCGELLNLNELANTLGISRKAVENYIYILQKSFIIHICPTFQSNLRKELTKMPKVFLLDSGYRNSLLNSFKPLSDRADGGSTFENLFFLSLIKSGNNNAKFWRTQDKHEVDFIVNDKLAFELKLNPRKFNENHYDKFKNSYPKIPLKLVVPDHNEILDIFDFCS